MSVRIEKDGLKIFTLDLDLGLGGARPKPGVFRVRWESPRVSRALFVGAFPGLKQLSLGPG